MTQITQKLRLPIGYENFGEIIEGKYHLVDKSLLIKDILDDISKVVLITRPRRFGKTLNLSMLQHFLMSDVYGRKTTDMFDGMKIMQAGDEYLKHQGKYPVIFISLKGINDHCFENAYASFCQLLIKLYHEYRYLLESEHLSTEQKAVFQAVLQDQANESKMIGALANLCHYLYLHHGERPWVLIDEYDSPIHAAYIRGYYEPMVSLMRSVLGMTLKTNPYLSRAVLTGILRIARESLFSELNNIRVYTILQSQYAQYFGFTEPEVADLLHQSDLSSTQEMVKQWYNGYQIGEVTVYNPWSIVNYIANDGELDIYWVNTGDTTLIQQLFEASGITFKDDWQQLLTGNAITVPVNETVLFVNLNSEPQNVWSLLFMAGYLKLVSRSEDRADINCQLTIPNQEILILYQRSVKNWLHLNDHAIRYDHLLTNLLEGNVELFEKQLSVLVMQMTSMHDMAREPEAFYQGLLLGLTATLSQHYIIKSNRESGLGRYDISILPRNPEKTAILLELKSMKSPSEKVLLKSAEKAIQQMEMKQYVVECQQAGFSHIILMGLAFAGKRVKISARKPVSPCCS